MNKNIIDKIKYIWTIAIILSLLTGLISFYILKPEYQTYTTIMIGKPEKSEEGIDYSNVLLFKDLVTTYIEIAKSKIVANQVIKNLDLKISYEDLKEKTKISMINETGIIKITVNDKSAYKAVEISNEFPDVIKEHIKSIMNIENIEIIDKAEFPIRPVKPKPLLNMFVSFILGIMISSFIFIYLDNFKFIKNNNESVDSSNRSIDSNLSIISIFKINNSLIISSSDCSKNLLSLINNLTKLNRKILIIDSNIKNKTISKYFNMENNKGLINIITEKIKYKKLIKNIGIKNTKFICAGNGNSLYFENNNLDFLIKDVSSDFDIIFIDSLPIGTLHLNLIYSELIDLSCNESITKLYEYIIENIFIM